LPNWDIVVVAILDSVIETSILIETRDFLKVILTHFEFENTAIFIEVLLVAHSREYNLFVVHVPV
jgi:hypothetical protein